MGAHLLAQGGRQGVQQAHIDAPGEVAFFQIGAQFGQGEIGRRSAHGEIHIGMGFDASAARLSHHTRAEQPNFATGQVLRQ